MNILIKLMSIVSLVIAPTLAQVHSKRVKVAKTTEVNVKSVTIRNIDQQSTANYINN